MVAKHNKPDQYFILNAFYAQKEGVLGAAQVTVDMNKHVRVELMGREPAAESSSQELAKVLTPLGDNFDTKGGCSFFTDNMKPDVMQFLRDNNVVGPKATHSPVQRHTTLSVGELVRGKILDPEIGTQIAQDVSEVLGHPATVDDIKTMPFPHKVAMLEAQRAQPKSGIKR